MVRKMMRRQWPPQGSYACSVVFRGAQRALAVGAGDRCAFSPGRNNFLLVTVPINFPVIRVAIQVAKNNKGASTQLNPFLFLVELARIELAAS
jgi:hypothetical protein